MRHNQNRRSRGRSRKGPNPLTRSFESNGPDVKVRGTAAHVAEKYMTLARDAHVSGDVVAAENYLQHAEHYNRIVMAAQSQFQQSQPQFREGGEEGYDDDDRQMNGRGRDRFEYNGTEGRDDDDRIEAGEGGEDRGYRPMQQQRHPDQDRQRGPRGEQRFDRRPDQRDQRDRPDQRDRQDNRDRPDQRDARDRSEGFQRQDEPQPVVPQPVEAAAPVSDEEQAAPPRRRRGRPPRGENGDVGAPQEGDDATPDGAAALAAFPD